MRRPDITRGGGGGGARLCSGFLVIFAICLYGFAAAFMVSVGTKLAAYRNITQSGKRRSALNDCSCNVIMTPLYVAMPVQGYTLLQALLGDFDFESLLVRRACPAMRLSQEGSCTQRHACTRGGTLTLCECVVQVAQWFMG